MLTFKLTDVSAEDFEILFSSAFAIYIILAVPIEFLIITFCGEG